MVNSIKTHVERLDLLSISQKVGNVDAEFELEQSYAIQSEKCQNNAPFIFFIDNLNIPRIAQGCCNNWLCSRCGQIRARHEYGRIVNGANELSEQGHELYFWTVTCRGKDMPLEVAQRDYLKWTNHLLTVMRSDCKKDNGFWAYAQVTERQQRLHPHSHIITTYLPSNSVLTKKTTDKGERDVYVSKRFTDANERAGLGNQHEITPIRQAIAVAVYVSKYLFKESISTQWPKNWKRVRYSQSWPKLPVTKPEIAWPLLSYADWRRVQELDRAVYCDSEITLEAAYARLITNAVLTKNLT